MRSWFINIKQFLEDITRQKTVTSKGGCEMPWRVANNNPEVNKEIALVDN